MVTVQVRWSGLVAGHGGTAALLYMCQPSLAMAKPGEARNNITTTMRLRLSYLGGWRCFDEARPRQRPWRHSGEGIPTTTQSEKRLT